MSTTRREFLSQAALAAAVAGLGPDVAFALPGASVGSARRQARPYLALAIRCGEWIDRSTQQQSSGLAWPADPLRPAAIGLDYYNGTPGVVGFMAQLAYATGEATWRERAQKGGEYLAVEGEASLDRMGDGLYTGIAGLGATFMTLDDLGLGPEWATATRKASARLVQRAKKIDDGVEWSGTHDIIGGTAGIGLFLLQAARKWNDTELADLAVRAGRRLLKTAQPAEGGLMWFPGAGVTRNYPNFSHGTAGVAYFLATLHQAGNRNEREFLDAALAGAKYLDRVSTRRNGARAVFHVTGGGEDRFYLSWCHGPVGTSRLFYRLLETTRDPQWRRWIDELTAWLLSSGAPEQQSAGYWNNISQCCGHVGIGQYCIDIGRRGWTSSLDQLRDRVAKHTLSRATDDAGGLRWVQAENRVSPEDLVAQTGFMQGAAGVGTFFLQLDAFSRRQPWRAPWPDTPWT